MPRHSYHSEQLDLVVTITYTGKKAATCFKFLSKRSDATLQSDVAMLGIPPFPHKSLELISQGCVRFSWQNILRDSPLHKALLKKIRPDDTRDLNEKLADLSIENLELDEFGEDDDDDESDYDNQDTYEYARKQPKPYDTNRFPGYREISSNPYDPPRSGTYGPLHFGGIGPLPLSARLGDHDSIQDSPSPHKKQKVDHPGTFLLQPSTSGINAVAATRAATSESTPPSQAVQISVPRKSTSPPSSKPQVFSQSPLPAQALQRSPPIPAAEVVANHSHSEQTSLPSSANAGHSVRETPPSVQLAALFVENASPTPPKPVNAVPAISDSPDIQAVSVQMPNQLLLHSTTPVLKSPEHCDAMVSTSEEHQSSRDIIIEEESASSMSIVQLKLQPQESFALASASISSLESSKESMLIGLQNELAGAHEQLIKALAKEDALKSQLLTLQAQMAEERRLRMEAEDALKDVERECKAPFVVPALLEAFVSISKLTTRLQAKVDVDMPMKVC